MPTKGDRSTISTIWMMAGLVALALPALAGRGDEMASFTLKSVAFEHGETIPEEYTCDGRDVSPPMSLEDVPDDARSLALVVDDPDAPAGTWDHWIVYGISPGTAKIPQDTVPPGARQGENSWGDTAWGGPCPPDGEHRYFFRLYALDTELDLEPGATKGELQDAMEGHVLGEAELMGRYEKKQ